MLSYRVCEDIPTQRVESTEDTDILSPTHHHHAIQTLEREFQQVKYHIKQLVLKKARRLHDMHKHKRHKSECPGDYCIDTHINSNSWKCVTPGCLFSRIDIIVDNKHTQSLFSSLPNEVLLHIFSYLSATNLCVSIMTVCSLFGAIALDESLWKPLYHQNWGDHNTGGAPVTWRYRFSQQSLTEQNWWHGRNTVSTLEGHKGAVRCMQFSGDMLVTGSADKSIKVWSLSSKQHTQELYDNRWIRCLRFDALSSTLVTTGMDSTQAKIWNLADGTVSQVLDVHRGWLTTLQLNIPRLVTGSLDGTIRVWDASTGHNQPSIVIHSGHDSLRSLWLCGDLLMSAGVEKNLQLWDLRSKLPARPSLVIEGAAHGNYCVQFDPHTQVVVSGSNSTVAVADLRAPSAPPHFLRGHTDVVSCLQVAGRKLVTGSMDHTIRVWDLATNTCPTTALHGHGSWVWDLQFDYDKIVSASGDNVVKLWAFNPV